MNQSIQVFFIAVLTVSFTCVKAQIDPPQFIPPSPSAYALGKYGEIPVGTYTGVPDITVPIWSLHENDLSVDVSLSYHGSGIKVDEIASYVGLGWSLNAGGVITRVIRGRAEYVLGDNTLVPERANPGFYSSAEYPTVRDYVIANRLEAAANGSLDTGPDEYYYNFHGRTGKFSFNNQGEARVYKEADLDIQLEHVGTGSFKIIITAENGVVYEFGEYSFTRYGLALGSAISSWYLTRIISPSGSEIVLEYQNQGNQSLNVRPYSEYVVEIRASGAPINPSITPSSTALIGERRIKKISTESGWIEFISQTTARTDIKSPDYGLDEIVVHQADGTVIRRFKLLTSYFEANDANKYDGPSPSAYQHLNYRLRLDAVEELSASGAQVKPPYEFVYLGDDNPTTNDVYTLPYRLSPAQDHWGYFNARSNEHIFPGNSSGSQIPLDKWFRSLTDNETGSSIYDVMSNGANREPDVEAVKASTLRQIYYPTGGYGEFFFEPNMNRQRIGAGLRIGKITYHSAADVVREVNYEYQGGALLYDPASYYYKGYFVPYGPAGPMVDQEILTLFGLPIESSGGPSTFKYVKITAHPQAVLGNHAQTGYASVKVAETGNGYTVSNFDNQTFYPDYTGADDFFDDIDMHHFDHIFDSQFAYGGTPSAHDGPYLHMSQHVSVYDFPNPGVYDNSWKRGVLTDRRTYSEEEVLLKDEQYDYHRQLLEVMPAFEVISWNNFTNYLFAKYYVPHALIRPVKYTVQEYDQTGANPVTTTTEYYYDNPAHQQVTRRAVSRSDGKKEVTLTTYPPDYSNTGGFTGDMKAGHLIAYPVEEVTYLESGSSREVISGRITTYKAGGEGLKNQELLLETAVPVNGSAFKVSSRASVGVFPPSGNAAAFAPDWRYQLRLTYNSYDSRGNVRQYRLTDGPATSYLWDYSGMYPVAEVHNAAQSQVAYTSFEAEGKGNWSYTGAAVADASAPTGRRVYALSGGSISKGGLTASRTYLLTYWAKSGSAGGISGGAAETVRSYQGWTQYRRRVSGVNAVTISGTVRVDALRLHPLEASMKSYTYDPLVGITSETDASGNILYYQYDDFQRLESIRDLNGNLVEDYRYHYRTP